MDKPTPPKLTVTRAPLSELTIEWNHNPADLDVFFTGAPRVRHQCPDCKRLWWHEGPTPMGTTGARSHPQYHCPTCRAERDFAALPWWRRTWARITGRR